MTAPHSRPEPAAPHSRPALTAPRGRLALAGLAVAVVAAGALILLPRREEPKPQAAAVSRAERAEFPANLRDGPIFAPGIFLDARTAIGTAPTPAGDELRLVRRAADGKITELRRRSLADNPVFDSFATDGTTVAWTETTPGVTEIWAADAASDRARRVTTDTGDFLGYGSAFDLVIADGAVHWAAAAPSTSSSAAPSTSSAGGPSPDSEPSGASPGADRTELRSVPLAGGTVTVREEQGAWAMSSWPWVVDGSGDQTGATRLRNLRTNRDLEVRTSGAELATCGPVRCRVVVVVQTGLTQIDTMRPDGSDRRRIAGPEALAALDDPAVLDRFEVLGRQLPDTGVTGAQGLVVHDLTENVTTVLSGAADSAHSRNGIVWWSTGGLDDTVWHTIDLRTAAS